MHALKRERQAAFRDMHIIGHSLGAHIAGYAGKRVAGTGRITGELNQKNYNDTTHEFKTLFNDCVCFKNHAFSNNCPC